MSSRKRNEYLDGEESEEESRNGYGSEEVEESRGDIGGRAKKRRRLDIGSDEDSANGLDEERLATEEYPVLEEDDGAPTRNLADTDDKLKKPTTRKPESLKPSTPKQIAAAQKAARRTGVLYISRVPPFMKPQTLRHFLLPHAPSGLNRIFLTPEDHAAHTRRIKNGGNKKKSYTDGWVEFVNKREAKVAAEMLNGNTMGGKKGNFYYDDLWSVRYLRGFKWGDLTEQIASENAERTARMREEIRKTRKENKAFVEDVERGKMLEGMETKRRAKGKSSGDGEGTEKKKKRPDKEFVQKQVQDPKSRDSGQVDGFSRVGRMIF